MKYYKITADCDWIYGHLKYGHFSAVLNEEEYKEYLKAKEEGTEIDFVNEVCELVVDDWTINDYESPTNIQVEEL